MSKVVCFLQPQYCYDFHNENCSHCSHFIFAWIAARSLLSKTADARLARLLAQQRQGHWRAEDSSPTGHSHCIFGRRWTIHLQNPIPVFFGRKKNFFTLERWKNQVWGWHPVLWCLICPFVTPGWTTLVDRGACNERWASEPRDLQKIHRNSIWTVRTIWFFTHFVTVAACFCNRRIKGTSVELDSWLFKLTTWKAEPHDLSKIVSEIMSFERCLSQQVSVSWQA